MEAIFNSTKAEQEIRTSLTCMKGYIDLLLNEVGDLSPTQATFLGIVDRSTDRLINAINQLLEGWHIDVGPQLVFAGGGPEEKLA